MINTSIFHDKTIDIYKYEKVFDSDECVTKKKYVKKFESVKCNVQPITSQRVKEQYGYDIECTKRVFIDYEDLDEDNIKESDIIVYKNKTYNVQKIIVWNTYMILLILEKEVKLDEQ